MKDFLRAKVEKARMPRTTHLPDMTRQPLINQNLSLPPAAEKALEELCFIAEHLENEEFERKVGSSLFILLGRLVGKSN